MLLVSEELKTLEAMMEKGGKKKYKICSSNRKKSYRILLQKRIINRFNFIYIINDSKNVEEPI